MKPRHLLILIAILLPNVSFAQSTVTVTGIEEDDENSRPKDDDGHIRDKNGNLYGPEADGRYETLFAAVHDLMLFGTGGTVVVGSGVVAVGHANVTKPLTLIGGPEGGTVSGGLTVTGFLVGAGAVGNTLRET